METILLTLTKVSPVAIAIAFNFQFMCQLFQFFFCNLLLGPENSAFGGTGDDDGSGGIGCF